MYLTLLLSLSQIIDEKSRKRIQSSIQQCSSFDKLNAGHAVIAREPKKESEMYLRIERRYERETKSLMNLKNELEQIEGTVKKIKYATLCLQAKDVYPRYVQELMEDLKDYLTYIVC